MSWPTPQERRALKQRSLGSSERVEMIEAVSRAQAGGGGGLMTGPLMDYLDSTGMTDAMPDDLVDDLEHEMYEAARAAAMGSLTDFARQAGPVATELIGLIPCI